MRVGGKQPISTAGADRPRATGSATPRPSSAVTSWWASRLALWWSLCCADLRAAWALPQVRRGTVGMALIGAGSMSPAFLPPDSPLLETLKLGWLTGGPARLVATVVLLTGVALLLHAWLQLRPRPGRPPIPWITWLIWSLPVLLAPPLFSRDAYSYAAQGLVVQRGMDPYQTGPIAVPGPFADQVDALWLYTPAPYGPLALQTQHFIVWLTGGNAYAAAVGMRLPALLSMAVIGYALPRLARQVGVSSRQAVWFGVLNPLVLLHLVGGAHNDAMMIALVCLGLYLASRGRLVWASVAVAAGAGFKQTAVLALVAVATLVVWARRDPGRQSPIAVASRIRPVAGAIPLPEYLRHSAVAGLVALVTFTGLTQVTGLGWGWVPNLSVPASLRSLLSPPTFVGSVAEGAMYLFGMPKAWLAVPVPLAQTIGGLAALAVIGWLTLRVAPRSPVAAAAGAFTALCLGGPVVHPWYLLWGGVLLGAVAAGRRVSQIVVLATVFLVGYSAIDAAVANGVWTLALTLAALAMWRYRIASDSWPDWRDGPRPPSRAPDPSHLPVGLHLTR